MHYRNSVFSAICVMAQLHSDDTALFVFLYVSSSVVELSHMFIARNRVHKNYSASKLYFHWDQCVNEICSICCNCFVHMLSGESQFDFWTQCVVITQTRWPFCHMCHFQNFQTKSIVFWLIVDWFHTMFPKKKKNMFCCLHLYHWVYFPKRSCD